MKKLLVLAVVLIIAAFMGQSAMAGSLSLDFDNQTNNFITFAGNGTFTIGGFRITSGPASLVNKLGNLNGTFTIGAITSSGSLSTAPVTGAGTFVIHDGSGFDFTASLAWNNISMFASAGGLNYNADINLTNFSYSGTNADLLGVLGQKGIVTLSFQFTAAHNLAYLKTNAIQNSFSGTLAVPEPNALLLIGMGFAALGGLRIFKRRS